MVRLASNKEDGKMRHAKIKHILFMIILVLLVVGVTLPSGICYAQRKVKGEWVLPKHYPDGFHGYGRIGIITADRVVIGDCSHRLSPFVKYATPTDENALKSRFRAGDFVGYIKNSKHEIESLWLLNKFVQ